jgi:hypothetical protein
LIDNLPALSVNARSQRIPTLQNTIQLFHLLSDFENLKFILKKNACLIQISNLFLKGTVNPSATTIKKLT